MGRSVTVGQLPDRYSGKNERAFVREMQNVTDVDRPSIVLDCSKASEFDAATIRFLLLCLEEAMKRNGDVRLAGISPRAMAVLEGCGAARLFRIFDSNSEAINSFHRPPGTTAPIRHKRRG